MKRHINLTNLVIVACLTVCGALTIFMATIGQTSAQVRALRKDFGTDLMALCDPPLSSAQVDAPVGQHAPLKVLVLERGSERWHGWSNALPQEWKATSRADVGLVVCLGEVTVQDYVCRNGTMYGSTTGGMVDVRVNQATVIDPVTRTVLARINFATNADAQACSSKTQGNAEAFVAAIQPYILGQNTQ